jgi:methyl-accepting chemotaxis protein-1 (serine sensor receptor)
MFKSLRFVMTLLGAIGVIASLFVAAQGYIFVNKMDGSATKVFVAKDVVADILPPPLYLIEARLMLSLMMDGSVPAADAQKRFEELAKEYATRVDYWKQTPSYGLDAKLLGAQHTAGQAFLSAARTKVLEPAVAGQMDVAKANLPAVHALFLEHRAGVDATVTEGNQFAESSIKDFDATHSVSTNVMLLTAVVAGVLVFVVYRFVLASIQKPIHASTDAAALIAKGDLVSRVAMDEGRTDSLGDLQEALQTMRADLNNTVSSVRSIANGVASASAEIAQGNQDLSARTESQASALEETAASMEQLTAAVGQNADSARQADQLAKNAAEVAERGGSAVAEVVNTIRGINESSRQIAGIVSTIEGIAFQTNILALNAAVEAARAGEQGRGFAVVASEVRSLAGRSAEAAKEIKILIEASVERVSRGSELADTAGATMGDMVQATRRVSDLLSEINAASREQSSGIAQVGEAVTQMDQVTQQNAALVEEMAAAAASLKSQADELVQQMAHFNVVDAAYTTSTANSQGGASAPRIPAASKPALGNSSKPGAKKALGNGNKRLMLS